MTPETPQNALILALLPLWRHQRGKELPGPPLTSTEWILRSRKTRPDRTRTRKMKPHLQRVRAMVPSFCLSW